MTTLAISAESYNDRRAKGALHCDGTWAAMLAARVEQVAGMDPAIVHRMLWEYASWLYGLGI